MLKSSFIKLLLLFSFRFSDGFLSRLRGHHRQSIERIALLRAVQLPTIEQLSTDSFMQQVQYGGELATCLLDKPSDLSSDDLKEMLQAQLSHSDGIRGFMVSYLTIENESEESFQVPSILVQALQEQAKSNPENLIPLAFMNVLMPTAMSTMHEQEELRQSSARTAKRGLCVLKSLTGQNTLVKDNAQAILATATDEKVEESTLTQYWTDFFQKWGYEDTQKTDISEAMRSILSSL